MTDSSASASPPSPVPLAIARSMLSLGIEASLAFWMANCSDGLPSGSPPPSLAATVIARASLVKSLPRRASTIAFLCLIPAHLECPAIARSLRAPPAPTRDRARLPREQVLQPAVVLRRAAEDALAARQRALPPQRAHALLGLELRERLARQVPAGRSQQVRLVDELERAVRDHAQPAMVRAADPLAVHAPGQLLDRRRDLDVARARDALQLRAHPHRVAQVLERVRADGEVELPVGERPRLPRAHVGLQPGRGPARVR